MFLEIYEMKDIKFINSKFYNFILYAQKIETCVTMHRKKCKEQYCLFINCGTHFIMIIIHTRARARATHAPRTHHARTYASRTHVRTIYARTHARTHAHKTFISCFIQ